MMKCSFYAVGWSSSPGLIITKASIAQRSAVLERKTERNAVLRHGLLKCYMLNSQFIPIELFKYLDALQNTALSPKSLSY